MKKITYIFITHPAASTWALITGFIDRFTVGPFLSCIKWIWELHSLVFCLFWNGEFNDATWIFISTGCHFKGSNKFQIIIEGFFSLHAYAINNSNPTVIKDIWVYDHMHAGRLLLNGAKLFLKIQRNLFVILAVGQDCIMHLYCVSTQKCKIIILIFSFPHF